MYNFFSSINSVFEDVFNELKRQFECNYISYMYQYNDYKLAFVTHRDWMDLYINNSLSKHCSLIRVGLEKISLSSSKSVILRWNDVQSINRDERNTTGIRSEFNICNGISFGRKILGASDYFGMAADAKNFDFPRMILLNSKVLKNAMNELFQASTMKLFYDTITDINPLNFKLISECIINPLVKLA